MGKILDKITNSFKSKPDTDNTTPTLEQLLDNLEQEDVINSTRMVLWNQRRQKEQWNFNDTEVTRLNVQSFVTAFQYTELCDEYGYFVLVKNINYIDGTATFVFKCHDDIREHTFHVFDFERVIRGCNEVLGLNTERTQYLLHSAQEVADVAEVAKEEPSKEENSDAATPNT